ncbi:hypothetical protein AM1_0207 [Acaryochloris marina MBIC11017]|uniref:Uncharacterized protein n=1 Tax=Acaryochloris marina (strain MBIC 11017) TaxID=329726 RepID=B0C7N3_ACAM1|nr:hypothetical protein AM1_0207 [Acaryochloris marina MBIC11017]
MLLVAELETIIKMCFDILKIDGYWVDEVFLSRGQIAISAMFLS